ncbi:unnamed protein product [Meganyctiphanes norvegica]|uniref:Secreted protein n=1 Tax=Meganyctiphanes norvegica TaxID=48144 RepID=A0AAV2RCP7_MEGNR
MRTCFTILLLSLVVALETVLAISCYHCQDEGSGWYYDPTCGMPDYHGRTENGEGSSCSITITGSGLTYRGFSNSTLDSCAMDSDGGVTCSCTIPQCNTNLCEQCQ